MAGYAELIIDKGTTFNAVINIADETSGDVINVSGYSFSSQIRKSFYSQNATASFTCIVNDGPNGNVSLAMSNTTTGSITPGRYVYDLRMVDLGGQVTRVVEGIVTVTPSVTAV